MRLTNSEEFKSNKTAIFYSYLINLQYFKQKRNKKSALEQKLWQKRTSDIAIYRHL